MRNGLHYNLYPDKVNYTTAEKACAAAGGELATLNPNDRPLLDEVNKTLLSALPLQHWDTCQGGRRKAFFALRKEQLKNGTNSTAAMYIQGTGTTSVTVTEASLKPVLQTAISGEGDSRTVGVVETCTHNPQVHFAIVDPDQTCCVAAFICTGKSWHSREFTCSGGKGVWKGREVPGGAGRPEEDGCGPKRRGKEAVGVEKSEDRGERPGSKWGTRGKEWVRRGNSFSTGYKLAAGLHIIMAHINSMQLCCTCHLGFKVGDWGPKP